MSENVQAIIDGLPPGANWGVEAADVLISAAAGLGCSDLHLSPQATRVAARGRRDGALFALANLPIENSELLVARLKVMANLPAFVRGEPQDGRIQWAGRNGTGERMLRVSFLPTMHGENVVIRFPEPQRLSFTLDAIGLKPGLRVAVDELLQRQEGMLVVTGPSSSGKTTTIYAMLDHLNQARGERLNVITIEDPIERDLEFAAQVQVKPEQNLTFERALRSALRQDPNVLMIGEIRDMETARIAVQAGMTGHLVISTLHAGRAAYVYTRLLSMGIEPYLVASALSGAIAQRLARTMCGKCKRIDEATQAWKADGCDDCGQSGYAGRRAIFELVTTTEPLRSLILSRASANEILQEAQRSQLADLRSEARALAEAGELSQRELAFVLSGEE